MIEAFKKIWKFSGNEKKNINKSVAVGFLNAVLQMFQQNGRKKSFFK